MTTSSFPVFSKIQSTPSLNITHADSSEVDTSCLSARVFSQWNAQDNNGFHYRHYFTKALSRGCSISSKTVRRTSPSHARSKREREEFKTLYRHCSRWTVHHGCTTKNNLRELTVVQYIWISKDQCIFCAFVLVLHYPRRRSPRIQLQMDRIDYTTFYDNC